MGVSLSYIKNSLTPCCLICFETAENKPPILTQIQCKPLCLPSHNQRQTEAQETLRKSGKVPLQVHTMCERYICRGIIFQKLLVL